MKIKFLGAAREVTGSRHLVTANGKRILLDCGLFQGRRKESDEKNRNLPIDPSSLDAILLSHAHIDHSGALPLFTSKGFRGPIYTTHATRDLCTYMLIDSAYIQEREAEYLNKRLNGEVRGKLTPLYTMEDAQETLTQFVSVRYQHPFPIFPGITVAFREAGHILGSAQIVLMVDDEDTKKQTVVVFSGDLGRKNLPLIRDPDPVERADVLIVESTYGDRFHSSMLDVATQLENVVKETCAKGGKIIIPAFAVERTQELIYHLNILFEQKRIPEIPIFVDSPLAVNITEIFKSHPEALDKATWRHFVENQKNPFGFGRLKYITDVEDSKALNSYPGPCIIISAAGMCEHGRILHHLKNNIEDPRTTILIVGYMAEHTLGRKIAERQPIVRIFGEPHELKANVVVMDAFSAHADRSDLLTFIHFIKGLKKIFLIHGEENQGLRLADILREEHTGAEIFVPSRGEEFEI